MRVDALAWQLVHNIIDYLAERSAQHEAPSLEQITKTKPPYIDACHASRIVDGGVDSQA